MIKVLYKTPIVFGTLFTVYQYIVLFKKVISYGNLLVSNNTPVPNDDTVISEIKDQLDSNLKVHENNKMLFSDVITRWQDPELSKLFEAADIHNLAEHV